MKLSHKISTRQHLVPGLIDASEDELTGAEKTGVDAWTVFTAFVFAVGIGLLVWGTRG